MKKTVLIVLCVILVAAPTIVLLGVYFFFNEKNADVVLSDIVTAEVPLPDGSTQVFDASAPEAQAFLKLHGEGETKATELVALPAQAQNYTSFRVIYTDSDDVKREIVYYLCADSGKCYFVNSVNQPYKIPSACADAFLNTAYAEKVYESSAPPEIKVAGVKLEPQSLSWNYKTLNGSYLNASCSFEHKDRSDAVGRFDAGMKLESNYEPDEVELTVLYADSGEELFRGDKAALKELVLPGSVKVEVRMTVSWDKKETSGYAGTAQYAFSGRLQGTPVFRLNVDYARCGEIVVLTAYNVDDPEAISIESTPAYPYEPVFYKIGQNYQALLPLAADLVGERTTYQFTVSSATASDILTLEVMPLNVGQFLYWSPNSKDYFKDDTILNTLRSNIRPILEARSSFTLDTYNAKKFVRPAEYDTISQTANYSFGMRINVDGTNKSFIAWDDMYCATERYVKDEEGKKTYIEGNRTEVRAAYAGKVVYIGAQTYTGRLVIIDHGSGLMTWYTNLSSDIDVHVGDTVEAGQFISHAADGGLNDSMNFNFHVGAFVNGVPVSLQQLISNGLIVEK